MVDHPYGRESCATKSILCLSRNSWVITQGASGMTSSTHLHRTNKKKKKTQYLKILEHFSYLKRKSKYWYAANAQDQSITMPLIFRKQITSKQESVLQTLQGGMVELINNSSTWEKKNCTCNGVVTHSVRPPS